MIRAVITKASRPTDTVGEPPITADTEVDTRWVPVSTTASQGWASRLAARLEARKMLQAS